MQSFTVKSSPLSLQQTRLWSMSGKQFAFHAQCAVLIDGSLHITMLHHALQQVAERHEILHTVFDCLPGMDLPVQIEAESLPVPCPVIDLTKIDPMLQDSVIDAMWEHYQSRPFDLVRGPLIYCTLLHLAQNKYLLLLRLSAFAADTSTLRAFVHQLSQTYTALHNQHNLTDEEPLQYVDISAWQNDLLQEDEAASHKAYWNKQKVDQAPTLHLPGERVDLTLPFNPATCSLAVDTATSVQIVQVAQEYHVTPAALALVCWQLLIERLSTTPSFIVGIACDGRYYEELADALGLYIRYVPMSATFEYDQPFAQVLATVHRSLEEAKKLQYYFVANAEDVPPFPISFTSEQWPEAFPAAGDVRFQLFRRSGWQEPFLLQLSLLEMGTQVQLELHYDQSRLEAGTVQRWAAGLQRLLDAVLAIPTTALSQLPTIGEAEAHWLDLQLQGERLPIPAEPWHELFERQVARTPEAPVLQSGQEQWSYQQLNAQANQLAHFLQAQGVGSGTLVGMCFPRGGQMIVALLAILKAGGTYVPFEPEQPAARLAYMTQQTQMPFLLTLRKVAGSLPLPSSWSGTLLCLDEIDTSLQTYPQDNLPWQGSEQDLAYVIYTSGSTGRPKGVAVRHRNLLNYTQGLLTRLGAQAGWHYATVSTLAADLGNSAIFGALGSGGCLHVFDYETITQTTAFAQAMHEQHIDVLKIVPTHLSSLLAALPEDEQRQLLPRQRLLLGGELVSGQFRSRLGVLAGTCRIYNHYGPTETTIGVLMGEVDLQEEGEEVPLGRPLANSWCMILDRWGQPVPQGVVGELYIGGAGVTAGYIADQAQNQERFVSLVQRPGERVYRTGDLVRMRADGQLVFVGRRDTQVKLRGYRIELAEIEAVLGAHPEIRESVVLMREDEPDTPYLAAYLVARKRPEPSEEEIMQYARTHLPTPMLPSTLTWLPTLPLTSNGKIDRQKLPRPTRSMHSHTGSDAAPEVAMHQPRTLLEELMQSIWQEVLKLPIPDVQESFFNLGGHSLLATQIVSRVRLAFGVDLSIVDFFAEPTIAGTARQVEIALQGGSQEQTPRMQRASREHPLPLSFAQQRLWFLDQLDPTNTAYNKSISLQLVGELNRRALEQSLQTIISRHEVLRTIFEMHQAQPVQVIQPITCFQLVFIDLSGLPTQEATHLAQQLAEHEGQQIFNLAHDLPVRTRLIKLNETEHHLVLTLHHIASDAWSNGIFVRELNTFYAAAVKATAISVNEPLPAISLQYADFAAWQRSWLQGQVLEEKVHYWREHLEGLVPSELPTDRPRSQSPTFRGARYTLSFSPEITAEIRKLSQKEGVTLFMTLLASFQLLLACYTQETDIAVGTPIANRHRAEIEHLIGFFVNTLVLRTDLSGSPTFRELLKRVRSVTLSAYAHQDVPFEKLVELLQPERDLSRSPLFHVLFSLQNVPMPSNELPGLQIHISENENRTTKFDLSVDVIEHEQSISCIVEYFTDLFDQATITRMLTHWQQLLQHIITNPEQPVNTISMFSEQELHQMLVDWNATAVEQVSDPGFQPRFELVAKEKADHIAIALDDTYLTYEKLNQRANQLAWGLQQEGVGPEVLVGVFLPRSLESILALLAILKAGGAYLPLDPDLPDARLSFLLQDAGCSLVLSRSTLSLPLPAPSPPTHQTLMTRLDLDRLGSSLSTRPQTAPYSPVLPANLAYMIYTSGSTGTPKGVAVTYQGIGNLASAQAHTFALSAHSRELQFASLSFDASISEIMMALLSGATLCLASQQQLLPGSDLLRLLHEQAITHLTLPPSSLAVLSHEENTLPDLQTLIVAGEACDPDLMSVWATDHHFFNAYGPTETTVCASIAACLPHEPLSIGRPITQTQLYVLDAHLQPVPIGVTGELYIGGIGLARGYHQRADLSAERFVPHPFSTLPGQRLYRSGDRVRYRADGALEYLGRLDEQVKLRGYRIEPGEIEQLIRQIPGVQSCVVLLQEHEGLGKQLVAYLVPAPGQNPSSDAIRLALREKVPTYLIPSFFIILEALPITTTGKVDRQALLAFTPAWSQSSETEGRQEEPLTPIEELVMMVWREVMHVPQLTRTSNFFALGGHSLLATQIAARIQTLVQISLPVRTLFEAPTIAELAERIEQISRHEHGVNLPPLEPIPHAQSVTLSFAQRRMWFLQYMEPHSSHYNLPMVMRLYGALNTKALERSLIEIICRHDSLRTTFNMVDGTVVQSIEPTVIFRLRQCDLRRLTTPEREVVARNLIEEDVERPFALDQKPPLRGMLIRLDTNEHILVVIMHHIISDGWSNSLFLHELTTLYPTFQRNMPAQLPALKVQYADFALWQHAWLQGDVLDRQLDYWKQQLQDVTTLALPTDRPRPLVQGHKGAREVFLVPNALSNELKRLSQRMGATLFMTLLSSFYVLLYRYTNQEDLLVGTPIANRHLAATESIIGFFVNTLVMRANLADNPTFEALLTQVREIALTAYTHQDAPFEKVVETVQPERDLSRTPLFQVLFTLQNFSTPDRDFGGIHAEGLEILSKNARFDLTLSVLENEQGLRCEMGYNRHLFDPGTIVRMSRHWQTLLQDCVARPGCAISDLTLLTPEEHRLLLQGNRQPSQIQPSSLCLHTLIEQRVERTPDTVAVVCADQQLTYHALNTLANQVASLLRQRGVGPEIPVGICLPPSPLLIVTVLAVLKAGGMYIPLDPAHPRERLARMLQDAQASLVVTQRKFSEIVSLPEEGCFYLDQQWDLLQEAPGGNPASSVQVTNAAYVLYTSGSTGTPKGVMVEHRALLNYVLAASERGHLEKGVYAMVQPFTVDSCVTMLFPALLTGGVLQLFSKEEALDVKSLVRSFTEAPADYLKIAPSHLSALLSEEIADKVLPQRTLIIGGEASSWEWSTRVQARMVQGSTMFSNYGPTETTVGSQMYQVQGGSEGVTFSSTPLGPPLAQIEIYVLDAQYQVVPIGVVGELYIGGAGLARGYLRRPEITAESFLPHPFGQEPGARLYKTGDLVCWHADGNLEFVGRRDEQIKIRGNRIELGEIEATLRQHHSICEAVVVAQTLERADKQLVAYVVAEGAESEARSSQELQQFLQSALPAHMVPVFYVWLEALPLTPHGKLDRLALPLPDQQTLHRQEAYVAPSTPVQETLAQIWKELLHLSQVGIHENFFALGGHSLLATQVQARIRQMFQVEIAVRDLFEAPTLDLLAHRIEQYQQETRQSRLPTLVPQMRSEAIPLSFAQQRLWFVEQLNPGTSSYHLPLAVWLTGSLAVAAFQNSLTQIVQRHEILRTTFPSQGGQPVQRIAPPGVFGLLSVDLRGLPEPEREPEARRLVQQALERPFDLERGPLLRALLVHLAPERFLFVLLLHHIITDGWSNMLLLHEFTTLYQAAVSGQPVRLPELPVQYADVALWQRTWLQGQVLDAERAYWKVQLADLPTLDLPLDHPRPAVFRGAGSLVSRTLSPSLSERVRRLSLAEDVTLFMTLLAAFAVLLQRYSQQEDFAIGTPVANRTHTEIEPLIGFFVNTLVLRSTLSGNPRFVDFLHKVRKTILEAYMHQDVPFEQVVEDLQPERDMSRTPLFQAMFVLQNAPREELQALAGMDIRPLVLEGTTSKFDLTLSVSETQQGLHCSLEYCTDLFDASTITRMLEHWQQLLEGIVLTPHASLAHLPLLTPNEQVQMLQHWNATQVPSPSDLSLHQLFEQQVERTPHSIAVVFEDEQVTYSELNGRANQLAHYLHQLGVGPEMLVGVCMQRSLEMVIGLLAVLKAGGAYVPLDPSYPQERLASLLEDAQVPVLLTQTALLEHLPAHAAETTCLDTFWETERNGAETDPVSGVQLDNIAYMIYTSGSTGKPKGVMNTHRGLTNHLHWRQETFPLYASDVLMQKTPISFDISIDELFWPLISGARLVIAQPGSQRDSAYLLNLLLEQQITTLDLVPSLLHMLLEEPGWPYHSSLRQVMCGGEALSVALLERFLTRSDARLSNTYGPTEAAVDASSWTCLSDRAASSVPIGYPISNAQIYILDSYLQPVPIGVAGELYIGGVGVARGYFNRPALTAEKFVADPFSKLPDARLFKTGDLARYRPDGAIEFLGRLDYQVKVRGVRIELGEIEAVLAQHPGIKEVVVTAREDCSGEKRLIAYVVAEAANRLLMKEVRHFLQEQLPAYMVPTYIMPLDALPLSANGKVNRKMLPAPDEIQEEALGAEERARTPTEELIVGLYTQVLNRNQVGLQDNFFEIGGHSLLATQIISRIQTILQMELPLRTLFEAPTVQGLAVRVEEAMREAKGLQMPPLQPVSREQALPLSFAQQRLWFLDQMRPGLSVFTISLALWLHGPLAVATLEASIGEILQRHEVLRTTFGTRDGQPVQLIQAAPDTLLHCVDLSHLLEKEHTNELLLIVQRERRRLFHLERGPVLRATLVRLHEQEHALVLLMHHIAFDGWSQSIFLRELSSFYSALLHQQPALLPALPIQYADYAAWQRSWLQGPVLDTLLAYWRSHLAGASTLRLPTDRPAPPLRTYRGARYAFDLPSSLTEALLSLSQQQEVTLFMLLLAAFQTILHRWSGQDDIVIGTDVANRNRVEIEPLIGFFINQLVLRTDLSGNPSFHTLLTRVKETTVGAYTHQDLPFEKLVEVLQPARDLHQEPFFQVKLLLQNRVSGAAADEAPLLPELTVSPLELPTTRTQLDLIITFLQGPEGLKGAFLYSTDLFDEPTIARMARQLTTLFEQVVRDPDIRIDTIILQSPAEKEQQIMQQKENKAGNLQKFKQLKPKPINLQATPIVQQSYLSPGSTLPLVLRPGQAHTNLLEWSQNNHALIEEELLKHGAILFRDFAVPSPADFERFASSLCSELFNENSEHVAVKGEGNGNLYTPVFYAPEKKLLWHNENSFNASWPRKIWFYCSQPASVGGETPIVDSRAVFQRIDPDIREAFVRKQIMYVRNYGEGLGLSWQTVFRATAKEEVEAYCRQAAIEFEWKDGDQLRTRQRRPAILTHPHSHELLWWNQATHWHPACLDTDIRASLRSLFAEDDLPRTCFYGDGSPIEDAVMQAICQVYTELEVSFPWQRGDILMLDNMLAAHARNPFEGPRKIYVSMGDMLSLHDVEKEV